MTGNPVPNLHAEPPSLSSAGVGYGSSDDSRDFSDPSNVPPSPSGTTDRAPRHVAGVAPADNGAGIETDDDFLSRMVRGIRDDVLGGMSVDLSSSATPDWIAPQLPRRPDGSPRIVQAAEPSTKANRNRFEITSLGPMFHGWTHVARARGEALNAIAVRAWRRAAIANWTLQGVRHDQRIAFAGVIVGAIIVVGGSSASWLVEQQRGVRPTPVNTSSRQRQPDAPLPVTGATTDVLVSPVRTSQSWWDSARDFLGRANPFSSAVASTTPTRIAAAPPKETVPVAAGARRHGSNPVAATQRPSKSRTQRSSANASPDRQAPSAAATRTPNDAAARSDAAAVAPDTALVAGSFSTAVESRSGSPHSESILPGFPPDPSTQSLIYDATSPDVVPPQPVLPELLGTLSPLSSNPALAVAVVVNEGGIVDSVKAVNAPRTMAESLLLMSAMSSIKSWHFRPAEKGGIPVKYRLLLPSRGPTHP